MPPTTSIRGHVELLAHDFHRKKYLEWARDYGTSDQEEIRRFIQSIRKTDGRPYDVGSYVVLCAFNNVAHFFYGAQLSRDHTTIHEFHQLLQQLGRALFGPQNQFLPWMVRRFLTWLPFTRNHRIASGVAKMDAINSYVYFIGFLTL
ncbi:hypothetical protein HPB50_028508 [Hyalomma asiaticum]|nr:hypothetical protein HPB50_028508 [Hyalomma asiaticum]